MMTKQEKLKKIYEVIADKTLSFGCRLSVELWGENRHFKTVIVDTEYKSNGKLFKTRHALYQIGEWDLESRDELTIIGHPVMIGDVIHYANVIISNRETGPVDYTRDIEDLEMEIIRYRTMFDIRKPIEDQDQSCIDFVYSLVKDD